MSERTLFLAWRDTEQSRRWFPVGQLDADIEHPLYRFRYTGGAEQAQSEAGFPLLLEFPEPRKVYQSSELFPIFKNRVMSKSRPDFVEYMHNLGLDETADPMQILAVSGGRRVTDAYEVFPKIEKLEDGSFTCRFFLHGSRYTNADARKRIERLVEDESLYVTLELTNPATGLAVQFQTEDYYMIGWAPRYLVYDLAKAMAESPPEYEAHVVRLNPPPAPANHRVLIEMSGRWDKHEPMSSDDYKPLVP
ncbi:MAG: DNA-binding protein [Chloroflexi bacterium]|nr:DNA-binding protein [Chloroflexota bacterium]